MSSQIIKQIISLIHENHFEEAQGVISRVAAVQATDPFVLREVGKLSLLMGDLEDAEKYLRASLDLDKSNYETHYQLGLVLLKAGKNDLAMPAFREACELKTDFALGYFYWGLALYDMGNIQGALGQFKLVIETDKSLFAALYYAGLAHQRLNEEEEARQYFEQTIAQEPDFAPAYNAIGVTCYKLSKTEEAITYFQRACKLRQDFASAHFNLANLFAKSGKYESAREHYREALNSPDLGAGERAIAYNNLAIAFGQLKEWETASECLLQAQSIAPDMVEININLGLVLVVLHEYDLAINHFEQILRNNPDQLEANLYGGMTLLCLGRYEEAQTLFAKASSLINTVDNTRFSVAKGADKNEASATARRRINYAGGTLKPPREPEDEGEAALIRYQQLYLWYGYASLANKQYDLAKEQFEKIILLDEEADKTILCLAFDALGLVSVLLDQQKEAIEYFDKTLKINPNLALAYLHRARSYDASGQEQLAKKDYAQALKLDPTCLTADKDYISQLLDDARLEDAITQAIKVLSLSPQDIESKLLLAKALQKKSDYSESLAILAEILKNSPDNISAYTMLGQIYMSQGDFAKADEIFQKAAKLDNIDAELFLSWARALAYLGFHELALEKFKQAADINPYDGDIYESWAQALKSLGRFNEASEVYRMASSYL